MNEDVATLNWITIDEKLIVSKLSSKQKKWLNKASRDTRECFYTIRVWVDEFEIKQDKDPTIRYMYYAYHLWNDLYALEDTDNEIRKMFYQKCHYGYDFINIVSKKFEYILNKALHDNCVEIRKASKMYKEVYEIALDSEKIK
jgi:hypothetical protein